MDMTDRRSTTRAAALSHPEVLQNVFEFIGARQYLIIASVSKLWRRQYKLRPRSSVSFNPFSYDAHLLRKECCRHKTCTTFGAVFSSVNLLAVHSASLPLSSSIVQYNAGRYADNATLRLAKKLGMPWSSEVVKGSA